MVWGTHSARRKPANDPAPPAAVAYAECFCGVTRAIKPSDGLPAGWRDLGDGNAQCPDCAHAVDGVAVVPALEAKGGHHGCRILHSRVADAVVLRIHAGARPLDPLDDRPVHFLARGVDLDELIQHLGTIRAELTSKGK